MTDLLERTAALVDIPSLSHEESAIADVIEAELIQVPWLTVERVGDNVVARTELGRAQRLVLAGHTDTVPANGNEVAQVRGDAVWGIGASDMKAGLAVFLELATTVAKPAVDLTYVFYVAEEVAAEHNGLGHLFRDRPDLVAGDAAILGEPTAGAVELGCQGTLHLAVTLVGERAHTARPWRGVNAVHRLGRVLALVEAAEAREPVLDGVRFHEALSAVSVRGGVAPNVVPDEATVVVNHRFAPDRSAEEAEASLRALLAPALVGGDRVELVGSAPAGRPGLDSELLASLAASGLEVRAKLGWTDVARFTAAGVPACNLGPGDPSLAHHRDEHVTRAALESTHATLSGLVGHVTIPA